MKNLNYISTRNKDYKISASEAIVQGLSEDGGLFIPESFKDIHFDLEELKGLSYRDLTKEILAKFLTDFTPEQIEYCVENAYLDKFDIPELVELTKSGNSYFLELWHGPTAAFKDMALTLLPYLLTTAAKNISEDKKIVILTATSGDTGKAALEGFKDVENTEIIVFYPKDGVSLTQELQMNTTEGNNTHVISVEGNFDDTQNGVKEIFNDQEFNNLLKDSNIVLSSANSINIGRLLPQIVYYFYSYFELVTNGVIKLGDKVNFVVPSGNFGDILAGYYAKLTGLPVNLLVCASNKNNILTDFFKTGSYDLNRDFFKTISPSMDILISSNLERLLYDKLQDSSKISNLMNDLKEKGIFEVETDLFPEYLGEFATEEEVHGKIKEIFKDNNILIDPHTAVGEVVREKLEDQLGDYPTIVLSTANPFKFSKAVLDSIAPDLLVDNEIELSKILEEYTKINQPNSLKGVIDKEILHDQTCTRENMRNEIKKVLNVE